MNLYLLDACILQVLCEEQHWYQLQTSNAPACKAHQRCLCLQEVLYNAFMYAASLMPRVTGIDPATGPIGGGTIVTFTGKSLVPQGAYSDSYDGWFSTGPAVEYPSDSSQDGGQNVTVVSSRTSKNIKI